MAAEKYLKQSGGYIREEQAVQSSSGVADAGKIPALNEQGVLDTSILNGVAQSSGSGDAGKTVLLGAQGRIDETMMPAGIGADVQLIAASEDLAAGDLVNIYNLGGVAKARKADATTSGKEACGYVKEVVTTGNQATVYFEGTNDQVTGMTPGAVFLSTTPGKATSTAPSGSGNVVQRVGIATSATAINFQMGVPIILK
ncbi:MAG: hypothetical protein AB1457_16340 [Chloroflexota bacterium]